VGAQSRACRPNWHHPAVDPRADAFAPAVGVDLVGKVQRRRAHRDVLSRRVRPSHRDVVFEAPAHLDLRLGVPLDADSAHRCRCAAPRSTRPADPDNRARASQQAARTQRAAGEGTPTSGGRSASCASRWSWWSRCRPGGAAPAHTGVPLPGCGVGAGKPALDARRVRSSVVRVRMSSLRARRQRGPHGRVRAPR
jgi:hypothetical protein